MQPSIFAVNDEPYCLWEADIQARNSQFLTGLDPDYFSYVLEAHIEAEDEKRALVALRLSLHHAIETLFSLLGAFIQAPDCAYAWIAKCSNSELRKFVERVTREDATLITKLAISSISWNSVSTAIFATYKLGTDEQSRTVECFSTLWGQLAAELTEEPKIDEYNALKHGFRIRPGGFGLAVGKEQTHGVPAAKSDMKIFGYSAYGATFFKIEKISTKKGSPHIRSQQTSVNWSLERVTLLLELVQMSINNVISALKIVNGTPPSICQFTRPENDTDFNQPWEYSTGITNMKFDHVINESQLPNVTKSELLEKLRSSK